jgi:hypothetical protein
MPDPLFDQEDDANTPLTVEERDGLIPSYITLRRELNEAEQINIEAALRWSSARRHDVINQKFLRALHQRMFGDVWRWAANTVRPRATSESTHIGSRWTCAWQSTMPGTGSSMLRTHRMKSPCGSATVWWPFIPFPMATGAFRDSSVTFS